MPCLEPTGDCTSVSGCADCDCSDSGCPEPVLPKCQDVALTPGTYTNATVVVNADGCITSITQGETPIYTPDDCCGDGGGDGSEGPPGPRGPKGDSGQAATLAVDPIVEVGTGDSWTVQNVGTTANAVFKFTAPAPDTTEDCCPDGFTGEVCGIKTVDGVVKTLPPSLVTGVTTQTTGEQATTIVFNATANTSTVDPCDIVLALNLDGLYAAIKNYIDNEIIQLSQKIDSSEYGLQLNNNVVTNNSAADIIATVKDANGNTIQTVTVPAGGTAILPNTNGQTYALYQGTKLVGTYSTRAVVTGISYQGDNLLVTKSEGPAELVVVPFCT